MAWNRDEVFGALNAPIDDEYVQRTKGAQTGKKYDTTGYAYQAVVDRMNQCFGLDWSYTYALAKEEKGEWGKNKTPYHEVVVNVTVTVSEGDKMCVRTMPGGHQAATYTDALKGAVTSGLKKVVATFGPGREAYLGTVDDDNKTVEGDRADGETQRDPWEHMTELTARTPYDNGDEEKPAPKAPAPAPAPKSGDPGPSKHMCFGKNKDKTIGELDNEQLIFYFNHMKKGLSDPKWGTKNAGEMAKYADEIMRRKVYGTDKDKQELASVN